MPKEWDDVTAVRIFRGATYEIHFKRGEDKGLFVNGERMTDNRLPLLARGSRMKAVCVF